jgi:hypothetical protein
MFMSYPSAETFGFDRGLLETSTESGTGRERDVRDFELWSDSRTSR